MDTSLHQYFMDTECANNSVSYDVTVCNEGEVCMAMVFDVKGRVHFWGTGRHCTYHNCTLRLPLCITVFTVFFLFCICELAYKYIEYSKYVLCYLAILHIFCYLIFILIELRIMAAAIYTRMRSKLFWYHKTPKYTLKLKLDFLWPNTTKGKTIHKWYRK